MAVVRIEIIDDFRQARAGGVEIDAVLTASIDRHALGQTGGFLRGGHGEQAVKVDVESHDDSVAPGHFPQIGHLELTDAQILFRVDTFPLVHLDLHLSLIVVDRGVCLGFSGGQCRAASDDRVAKQRVIIQCCDAVAVRRDVHQDRRGAASAQCRTLNGGTHRDDEIGVHFVVRFTAQPIAQNLLHERGARGTTHQEHFGQSGSCEAGIGEGALQRVQGALQKWQDRLVVIAAVQLGVEVLFAGDEFLAHVNVRFRRKLNLGFLHDRF